MLEEHDLCFERPTSYGRCGTIDKFYMGPMSHIWSGSGEIRERHRAPRYYINGGCLDLDDGTYALINTMRPIDKVLLPITKEVP